VGFGDYVRGVVQSNASRPGFGVIGHCLRSVVEVFEFTIVGSGFRSKGRSWGLGIQCLLYLGVRSGFGNRRIVLHFRSQASFSF
jgi:hypothetical protein